MAGFIKNKLVTIIIISATLILAGIAIFTALRLYKLRNESVSPAKPESKPAAQQLPTQPPSSCDVDLMLVLDRSSSMTQNYAQAKIASRALVNALDTLDTQNRIQIGISSFGPTSSLDSPLTNDFAGLLTDIESLPNISSGTCISCGLKSANDELIAKRTTAKQLVLLLSDGMANRTLPNSPLGTSATQQAINEANRGRQQDISYFVVGYSRIEQVCNEDTGRCRDRERYDPVTLTAIADDPDSDFYFYRPSSTDWTQAFTDIANEVCSFPTEPPSTSTSQPTTTATASSSAEPTTPPTFDNICTELTFSLSTPTATSTATSTATATATATSTASATATATSGASNTPTPTSPPGATVTPTARSTTPPTAPPEGAASVATPTSVSTTPSLPNAGVGTPTLISIAAGIILLVISLALAL